MLRAWKVKAIRFQIFLAPIYYIVQQNLANQFVFELFHFVFRKKRRLLII